MSRNTAMILSIDQGTTGTRAILYDQNGSPRGSAYREFRQYYPCPGWVEHDADEIWRSVLSVTQSALEKAGVGAKKIAAIGITNQRETTVLWDKRNGKPVGRAIVWQDRRTAEVCERLKKRNLEPLFRNRTGLVLDPYFSGTKIQWFLENHPQAKKLARNRQLLFGTIDTWLLWNLTGGKVHATDPTNASRTLLLNLKTKSWDRELLKIVKVPVEILPAIHHSASSFGKTASLRVLPSGIPICSLVGDQQAALFGQSCYGSGEMKNTYGTGCFLVMNEGQKFPRPSKGLLGTLACDEAGRPAYALEGAVFIAGAAIQWLRDGLGLIRKASETEAIARKLKDTGGVVMVPALTGLGAPHWNPNVRGAFFGLTRGTRREHLIKATLDSIAYQTHDIFQSMREVSGLRPRFLKVDGGAAKNDYLMQLQADLLGVPVVRPDLTELTAWGAAKLAGIGCGLWKNIRAVDRNRPLRKFSPRMDLRQRTSRLRAWNSAITCLLGSSDRI